MATDRIAQPASSRLDPCDDSQITGGLLRRSIRIAGVLVTALWAAIFSAVDAYWRRVWVLGVGDGDRTEPPTAAPIPQTAGCKHHDSPGRFASHTARKGFS